MFKLFLIVNCAQRSGRVTASNTIRSYLKCNRGCKLIIEFYRSDSGVFMVSMETLVTQIRHKTIYKAIKSLLSFLYP
jgi:hypothetical protein